jgi:exosome complex exonuclease DIS3/RRP44
VSRYADIIVHRLLAVAIGADCTYPELTDKHKLADICKNLNFRHKMSQYAQRASVAFHTQVFASYQQCYEKGGFKINFKIIFVNQSIFRQF